MIAASNIDIAGRPMRGMSREEFRAKNRLRSSAKYHHRLAVIWDRLGGACAECGATSGLAYALRPRVRKPTPSLSALARSASDRSFNRALRSWRLLCEKHHPGGRQGYFRRGRAS